MNERTGVSPDMGGSEFSGREPHTTPEDVFGAAEEVRNPSHELVDQLLADHWYRREVAADTPSFNKSVDPEAFLTNLAAYSDQGYERTGDSNNSHHQVAMRIEADFFEERSINDGEPQSNGRELTRAAILASIDEQVDKYFMERAVRANFNAPGETEPDQLARKILGMHQLVPGAYLPRVTGMIIAREQMRLGLEQALVHTSAEAEAEVETIVTQRETVQADLSGVVVAGTAFEARSIHAEEEVVHEAPPAEVDEAEFALNALATAVIESTRGRVNAMTAEEQARFVETRDRLTGGAGKLFPDAARFIPDPNQATEAPQDVSWFPGYNEAFGQGAGDVDVYAEVPDVITLDTESTNENATAFGTGHIEVDEQPVEVDDEGDEYDEAHLAAALAGARAQAHGEAYDYRAAATAQEADPWADYEQSGYANPNFGSAADDLGSVAAFKAFMDGSRTPEYVVGEMPPAYHEATGEHQQAEADTDQTFPLHIPIERRLAVIDAEREYVHRMALMNVGEALTIAQVEQAIARNLPSVDRPESITSIIGRINVSLSRIAERDPKGVTALKIYELVDEYVADHIRQTDPKAHGVKNRVVRFISRNERTKHRLNFETQAQQVRRAFFGKRTEGQEMQPVRRRQVAA